MKLQDLINSRYVSGLALFLARVIPERFGYAIADRIATIFGSMRHTAPAQAVRANQWIVSQKRLTAAELDQRVLSIFRFTGYALYDYYHNLTRPHVVAKKVIFTERLRAYFERLRAGTEGTLIVLPHMGNFDIAGMALALEGLDFQVLSYPRPPGGYQLQNRIRKLTGVDAVPMSFNALRAAGERLEHGGTVLTGMDRPLQDSNYHPRFFGIPAALPVAYVRLALKTAVPIITAAVSRLDGGNYLVDASEPVYMEPRPDHRSEIEQNAERVLRCAEDFIRRAPEQWVMYYPVWPDALKEMP